MSEQTKELSDKIEEQIRSFTGPNTGGSSLVERTWGLDDRLQSKILWSGKEADTLVGNVSGKKPSAIATQAGFKIKTESGKKITNEQKVSVTFGVETWLNAPLFIHAKHQKNVIGKQLVTTVIDLDTVMDLPDWAGYVILRVTANILLSNWSVNGAVGSVANIYNRVRVNGKEAVENDLDHTMWEWVRLAGDRSIFTVNLGYTNSDVIYVPFAMFPGGLDRKVTVAHEAQNTSRATAVVEVIGYGST